MVLGFCLRPCPECRKLRMLLQPRFFQTSPRLRVLGQVLSVEARNPSFKGLRSYNKNWVPRTPASPRRKVRQQLLIAEAIFSPPHGTGTYPGKQIHHHLTSPPAIWLQKSQCCHTAVASHLASSACIAVELLQNCCRRVTPTFQKPQFVHPGHHIMSLAD